MTATIERRDAVAPLLSLAPGLSALPPDAPRFTPSAVAGRGVSRHLREKLAVLGSFPARAMQAEAGFDPSPALAVWAARAARDLPDGQLAVADDGTLTARRLGWQVGPAGTVAPAAGALDWPEIGPLLNRLPPGWRRAGLLSLACAEDVAVVEIDPLLGPRMRWMVVALPSTWAPEQHVGQHFVGLPMAAPPGEAPLQRCIWSLAPQRWLHGHPLTVPPNDWPAADQSADALADRCWLRIERQSMLPVDATHALVIFRVDTMPLRACLAASPQAAVWLRGVPPPGVPPRLAAWLAVQG